MINITIASIEVIRVICNTIGAYGSVSACATIGTYPVCTIYIADTRLDLLEHEYNHCKGMRHN